MRWESLPSSRIVQPFRSIAAVEALNSSNHSPAESNTAAGFCMISLMTTSPGRAVLRVAVGVGVAVAVRVAVGVSVLVGVAVLVGVSVGGGGAGLAAPGEPKSPALPGHALCDVRQFAPTVLSSDGAISAMDAPSGLGKVGPPS